MITLRSAGMALLSSAAVALAACGADSSGATGPSQPPAAPASPFGPGENNGLASVVNAWATRAPLQAGRHGLVAATVNGVIYAIGGRDAVTVPYAAPMASVERLNPDASLALWFSRAPLPEGRSYASGAAVINGKIYVPGGVYMFETPTRTLFVYNPKTNTWASKANMPIPSGWGASVAIDGKLYVFTPRYGNTPPRLHRYDPATNTWAKRADPPRDHKLGAAGVINGKLYIVGGSDPSAGKLETSALDVYNPATNTWAQKKEMPTARYAAAAVVIGGRLLVAGGKTATATLTTLESYNPGTNSWVARAPMPTARYDLAAVKRNDVLFAVGGSGYMTAYPTTESYTP